MSSFINGVPPKATFMARYNLIRDNGSVSVDQPLPTAGLNTVGAEATFWGQGLSLLWRPPLDLGGRWSHALSTSLPYMWVDLTANVTDDGTSVRRTSSLDGPGDIILMPLMLNHNTTSNWNANFGLAGHAATGDHGVGRLVNTSKHF